jgi:hypothetical protein
VLTNPRSARDKNMDKNSIDKILAAHDKNMDKDSIDKS